MLTPWALLRRLMKRDPFASVQRNTLGMLGIDTDTGLIALREGGYRAVLRLPGLPFADEGSTQRTLGALAAAVNGAPTALTLLCWAEPTGAQHALAQQQARVQRLRDQYRAHPSRHKRQQIVLAASHAQHLEALATQQVAQTRRPRRTTFALTLDGRDPAVLVRQADDVAASLGGRRLRDVAAITHLAAQGWRPAGVQVRLPAAATAAPDALEVLYAS